MTKQEIFSIIKLIIQGRRLWEDRINKIYLALDETASMDASYFDMDNTVDKATYELASLMSESLVDKDVLLDFLMGNEDINAISTADEFLSRITKGA